MKQTIKIISFLAMLGASVESPAQGIADVARMERARQRSVESKAVFTPVTIRSLIITPSPIEATAEATAAAPAAEASQTTETAPPAGPTDNQGRDEKWWRNAFSEARTDLSRAESKARLIDLKITDLKGQILSYSNMYNRENRIAALLTAADTELVAARADVETARQKIVILEEQLRQSGGMPGWAR